MCQPKPGPRCASHVSKELAKAEKECAKNPSGENLDAVSKLKKDYDSTPTGQKALAAEIVGIDIEIKDNALDKNSGRKSLQREILSQRLEAGITLRNTQKKLLKESISGQRTSNSMSSSGRTTIAAKKDVSPEVKARMDLLQKEIAFHKSRRKVVEARSASPASLNVNPEVETAIEKHRAETAAYRTAVAEKIRDDVAALKASILAPRPQRIGNRLSLVTDQDVKGLSPESIEKVSNPKNEFYARAYRMQVDKFQNGDGQEEVSFSLSVGKKYNDHIVRCISHARSLGAKVEVTSSSGLFKTSWGFNATGPSSAVSGFLLNIGPIMGSTVDE